MKRKGALLLMILLLMTTMLPGAMAESLDGKWSGKAKISGFPISISATVTFDGGGFSVGIVGLNATGSYVDSGDGTLTITLKSFSGLLASRLESPENIGSISLPYTLTDGELVISGGSLGVEGTVTLKRK